MKSLNIYIGFDGKETVAYHALCQSIIENSSVPVSFTPIYLKHLGGIYNRDIDARQSNEFSFSRFLVPYLQNYQGFALFMDCDMMLRTNIKELFDYTQLHSDKAVHVVKHNYEPKNNIKYLDNIQYNYPRKNWSSVVLWNCGHKKNKSLDLHFINNASPAELHRFSWLDDAEIGSLDITWNWLVGELEADKETLDSVKNVHWTIGGPYFKEYANVEFAIEWFNLKDRMNYCKQKDDDSE